MRDSNLEEWQVGARAMSTMRLMLAYQLPTPRRRRIRLYLETDQAMRMKGLTMTDDNVGRRWRNCLITGAIR